MTLDRALESAVPALLALLDVTVDDRQWSALDSVQRRQRTQDTLKRLFLREAQMQPLLVIFEDLHWIDSETQTLLDSLVESLPTVQVLLLVNYRPEYSHGWSAKTYYTQLRLDALPSETAGELLDALLGGDPSLHPLKALLAERTVGNPLFLEESVRALVETKALVGEPGAYRLAQRVGIVQMPATVQTILASRIDRLLPEEKQLLQTAAVIGKDFPLALLQEIADQSDDQLRQGLDRLQAAEFLYQTSLFPDLEYTFKHALTHEVAYGSLLQARRRGLHARIVEGLTKLYPDRLTEHVERLGHHALRGERWDQAVAYLRQAGAKAADRTAHREAITFLEQALQAVEKLPDGAERLQHAIDVRLHLRNSLFSIGDLTSTGQYLHEAEVVANKLGDTERASRVASILTHYFWVTGSHDRAVAIGERALSDALALKNSDLQLVSRYYLSLGYHGRGHYPQAIDHLDAAISLVQSDPLRRPPGASALPSVVSRMFRAWCLAEQGDFTRATETSNEATRIAEENGQPANLIHAYLALGLTRLRTGEVQLAIDCLTRGLGVSQTARLPFYLPWIECSIGYAYALSEQAAEAVTFLNSGLERAASMNVMVYHPLWLTYLSEYYLRAGRVDDAERIAERALNLSITQKEEGSQAWALRMRGAVAAERGAGEEHAGGHYRDAIALATELGMRPLLAHCHLGLGKLYRRTDKRKQAQEYLATATTMYREMGMTYWLEKAEVEMRDLG
jgi:tetratricopeptide (TPR) repeat protein